MTVKFSQKSLQLFCHERIFTFHSISIYIRKCNTIDGCQKGHLDTVYQGRHRISHKLIIRRIKILKSPHKSYKRTKNTKTGKNIRYHFQEAFMYMIIHLLFIQIILYVADSFFTLKNTVCKRIHHSVQIFMMKNPIQRLDLICSDLSRLLKKTSDFV